MALDEVVLTQAVFPIVRVYGWLRPSVSIGYFEEWRPVAERYPDREFVRRWTGGGVVLHGEDWTYSVIVPRSEPFARMPAAESYKVLHEKLAEAFSLGGVASELTPAAQPKVSQACFENPAQFDLLTAGRKIAGAAQRRSRFGLLHQGSVQGVDIPVRFEERLAGVLGSQIVDRGLSDVELDAAVRLAAAKYATVEWNRKY